jgi:hypothetical protein
MPTLSHLDESPPRTCSGASAASSACTAWRAPRHPPRARRRRRHRRRRLVGRRGAGPQRRRHADAGRPRPRRRVQHQPPDPRARSTVGQAKVLAMRERIAQIHPGLPGARRRGFRRAGNWPQLLPAGERADGRHRRLRPGQGQGGHGGLGAPDAGLFIACGAAGGKRLAHKVDIDDLSLTTHDPLLAQVRYRLRKFHGAPREGKKIGVPASSAARRVAPPDASCAIEGDGSLNCHGYGSVVSVTATFGQCAAGWVLDRIERPESPNLDAIIAGFAARCNSARQAKKASGTLAQLVEQRTFNPFVTGSTPVRPTMRHRSASRWPCCAACRAAWRGHSPRPALPS